MANAGSSPRAGTMPNIKDKARTGQSREPGICINGRWTRRLLNWFVLLHLNVTIMQSSPTTKSLRHSCLLASKDFAEGGTRLLFRAIQKKATKHKAQNVTCKGSNIFRCNLIASNKSGEMGKALLGRCFLMRSRPRRDNFMSTELKWGHGTSCKMCKNLTPLT